MLIKDLQKLGFTKNLATIYLMLFELGEARAGELVRRTGMHRNLVYTALDKLEEKKLIIKSQMRGAARYKVLEPTRVMSEVEEKSKLAQQIIEELQLQYKVASQEVVVYEGKEELIKKYLEATERLQEGGTYRLLGFSPVWYDVVGEEGVKKFKEGIKKNKLTILCIGGYFSERERQFVYDLGGQASFRLAPTLSQKYSEINILEDRVFITILVQPYTVIEIINKDLVSGYKEHFDMLWQNNTQTLRGEKGARSFLEDTLNYSDVYWIGGNGGVEKFYPATWDWYKDKRVAKKVKWHDLIDPGMKLTGSIAGKLIYDDPYYEYKLLPETVAGPHVICIYGDKVANIVWKEDGVITIIEDKETAKSYKNYFNYLWKQEVKTYAGWEEIEKLFWQELVSDLKSGDKEYVIGAGYGESENSQRFDNLFLKHNGWLIKNEVVKYALFYEKHRERFESEVKKLGDPFFKLVKIRYLPNEFYSPVETHITDSKCTITYFGDNPVATLYTNPGIISGFKNQFEMLWSLAKD
jgi:DNA-binding MarR family transcriptional regulator